MNIYSRPWGKIKSGEIATLYTLVNDGGITVEIHVDATGHENIAEAIKAQADEIAETMAGIMADAFGGIFENTPVRA